MENRLYKSCLICKSGMIGYASTSIRTGVCAWCRGIIVPSYVPIEQKLSYLEKYLEKYYNV